MLTKAGQAEILRATQRDENFRKQLSEHSLELLQLICGIHFWIKYKDLTNELCGLIYQMMTTMSNLQTLGEEYTGIIQVSSTEESLPKKYKQFLMILLKNFGEKFLTSSLKSSEACINKLPEENPLRPEAKTAIIKILRVLRTCLPIIVKFHKGLFYLNGHYYEIGKRLCSIKYALIRFWLKDRLSLPAFKLLGIVSLIHSTLYFVFTISNYKNIIQENNNISKVVVEKFNKCDKCPLCLNSRQQTSVTSCGHLFCWSCIILWLQEQQKCPLCRQALHPSKVVFLQNYSCPD